MYSYEILGAFASISKHVNEENKIILVSIDWEK